MRPKIVCHHFSLIPQFSLTSLVSFARTATLHRITPGYVNWEKDVVSGMGPPALVPEEGDGWGAKPLRLQEKGGRSDRSPYTPMTHP